MTVREIVEVKRKIERSLSTILLLCITYRSVYNTPRTKEDFMYYAKSMAQRLPVQDKHFALLFFCRGILQPAYADTSNQTHENGLRDEYKVDLQGLMRPPMLSLRDSFIRSMNLLGVNLPSSSSRMLFPFAAAALRAYHAVADNEPFFAGDRNDELFGSGGDIDSVKVLDTDNTTLSHSMYSVDEHRLCELFRDCADIDVASRRSKGLQGVGAELLSICGDGSRI